MNEQAIKKYQELFKDEKSVEYTFDVYYRENGGDHLYTADTIKGLTNNIQISTNVHKPPYFTHQDILGIINENVEEIHYTHFAGESDLIDLTTFKNLKKLTIEGTNIYIKIPDEIIKNLTSLNINVDACCEISLIKSIIKYGSKLTELKFRTSFIMYEDNITELEYLKEQFIEANIGDCLEEKQKQIPFKERIETYYEINSEVILAMATTS